MLGCVVGTGNIWRFPRIMATHAEEGGMCYNILYTYISEVTIHNFYYNNTKPLLFSTKTASCA